MKRSQKKRKDVTINLSELPHVINACIKNKCAGSLMITAIGVLSNRRAIGWSIENVELDKENKRVKFIHDNETVEAIEIETDQQTMTSIEELKNSNYDAYIVINNNEFSIIDDWVLYATVVAPKMDAS